MKPTDRFTYLAHNWLSPNQQALHRLYLPIMGPTALALYHYFVTFFDDGAREWSVSHLLDQLQLPAQDLSKALDYLTALSLLELYQESRTGTYLIQLKAPLATEDFLANPAFRALLEKALGTQAVADLEWQVPADLIKLSKSFSAVFSSLVEPDPSVKKPAFDLVHFKQRMTQDGLRFAKEQDDVLALYDLAERFKLDWLALYQLAKATSYQRVIYPKRILSQKEREGQATVEDLSPQEKALLREVRAHDPEILLAQLKKKYQASLLESERRLIGELVAKNLLDEVINVIIMYSLRKTNSANLNRTYVLKLANDFVFKKINSAEAALIYLRVGPKQTSQTKKPIKQATQSNVPKWSNQDYQNQTSADEKARLEAIKQERLAQLRKED